MILGISPQTSLSLVLHVDRNLSASLIYFEYRFNLFVQRWTISSGVGQNQINTPLPSIIVARV